MPGTDQVDGSVKERGEKNGAVFFVLNTPNGPNKTAKVWVGNEYKGDVPDVGGEGTATFQLEPVGDYELKKLVAWTGTLTGVSNGSQNGSQTPSEAPSGPQDRVFVGRDPGLADKLYAARWGISAAIDALGPGKANLSEYIAGGAVFYAGMQDIVEKADEAKKSEA